MRIRIFFEKTEAMRFTGHLDLHKTWERTFRRTGLPLAYSQGFHPQPRLNLACALPLGFTSQAEIIDAWLETGFSLQEIQTALEQASPPGIKVQSIGEVDPHSPALQTQVKSVEYDIHIKQPVLDLQERIDILLTSPSLPRVWREKTYDLRPLVEHLELLPGTREYPARIKTRLSARQGATGRPEELLSALGIPTNQAIVHRTSILMQSS